MDDCGIPGCSGPVKGKGWGHMAPKPPDSITAQFDSVCPGCHGEIVEGDEIYMDSALDAWVCWYCGGD